MATTDTASPVSPTRPSIWLVLALIASVIGLKGSLWLSLHMGLLACPLCFYQRTFMMSLFAVLGVGLLFREGTGRRLGLLAFPLATAGLGVALFHVWLELSGVLECPPGILGLGTAPQQSLAGFVLIFGLLGVELIQDIRLGSVPVAGVAFGLILGGVLAVASCTSNPPLPPVQKEPYPEPPKICRRPFQPL